MTGRLFIVAGHPAVDRTVEVGKLTVGEIHRPVLELALPGGKGINVARAARALGADVTVAAILGGHAGDWVAAGLAEEGVDTVACRIAAETRTCLSIVDTAQPGQVTEFYERGVPVPEETWGEFTSLVGQKLREDGIGALVLSGSLPPHSPPDVYAQWIRLAHDVGIPVLVDASGSPLMAALDQAPELVKVNLEEALTAMGTRVEPLEAIRWLVDRGAARAVVTLGADGAIGLEKGAGAAYRVGPASERGRYPVGSGDAFIAALAWSFVSKRTLSEGLVDGMAAGIANALVAGAGRLEPEAFTRIRGTISSEPIPLMA